jgi:hypothetical protein
LENVADNVDVIRAWESIKILKLHQKRVWIIMHSKQHKPWFEEECSELLDHRKQGELQWLKNPS